MDDGYPASYNFSIEDTSHIRTTTGALLLAIF
jgi:hypothetical protein